MKHAKMLVGFVAILLLPLLSRTAAPSDRAEPTVYVFLWFDTEDYLLPADDDATLHLCEFLTREGIRSTHKLVGEKARVLVQRGRNDVLAALRKHEIGYHTDFHSVQPTPALFLSRQGWDDGVAEFDRRERSGLLDVERITGQKPTCYGQPGSSWGPQQFGAMRQWGVPVYLDAGSHVKLDGGPFWYCGILNLYALKATTRTSLAGSADLDDAKKRFDAAYRELLAEGGGPMSIYYHPCEFVHKQFWDGVNFAKGANPARADWKIPPQKTPEESRVAYETFEAYIRYIKSHPQVRFLTASEGLALYGDRAQGRRFSRDEIAAIRQHVARSSAAAAAAKPARGSAGSGAERATAAAPGMGFYRGRDFALSAAELLYLLVQHASMSARSDVVTALDFSPLGPTQSPPTHEVVECDRSQMTRTIADVADYLKRHQRVPNAVWLGSRPVSPESFLKALAGDSDASSDRVRFEPTGLDAARYVSDDDARLWGWVIFPPGFRAPEMMQLARRQAWTLKPALLHAPSH